VCYLTESQRSQRTKGPQPEGSIEKHLRQGRRIPIQQTEDFSFQGFSTGSWETKRL